MKNIALILFTFLIVSVACNKDDDEIDNITTPTLSTLEITDITKITATSGGDVTNGGGNNVTARGVCWSTSSNPTTSDSHTSNETGTGSFTSSLTDLTQNTTYYVRAYATNNEGTAYGNQKQFSTLSGDDDTMFIHVATAANISNAASYIDHPDLNANPNAMLVVSHRLGIYNDKITGLWYNSGNQRWAVFNEDASPMLVDSQYNVYIKGNIANVIVHIASATNQGSSPSYTVIDEPSINGNPNPFLVLTSYWSPNSVYNNYNYGFWYNSSANRWIIYTEDGTAIPNNAAFMVLIQPYEQGTSIMFRHEATPTSNGFYSNSTLIDHPLLNNKPNASFVFTHYWGAPGYPSSNVVVDKTMGTWYSSGYNKWVIYTEDQTSMVDNAVFNIVVPTN